ncbi:MAG: LysM domain-containing protein [Myxococcota bacterium]|nr:LysM domain-containing protein [Myxococcota bacterium]
MRAWLSMIVLIQALAVGAALAASPAADPTLGPWAVDEDGNAGRIHTVVPGDTLWDISASYLGTAWVWPSVWRDNEDIADPHLILPEDRIWITAGEMRKITRERADAMIAAGQEQLERAQTETEVEAILEEATREVFPPGPRIRIAERGAMGFVSTQAVQASTSIVGSPSPRQWLADNDLVYIGQGQGEVEVGDEFTLYRDAVPVYDLGGRRKLGYHVDILGWLVVREVEGDTATAEIRMSRSEIERGDRLIPRIAPPSEVEVTFTPEAAEANIVFIPEGRAHVADGDFVYLNRGSLDGLRVGSELEVYKPGGARNERVRGVRVTTPDRSDATLVAIEVGDHTAVAYVTGSRRPLEVGDRVRGRARRIAQQ